MEREQLCSSLSQDPEGHLGRCYPKLAAKVQEGVPDTAAMQYYAHPLCSQENAAGTSQMSLLTTAPCDAFSLARLAQICERLFTWGTANRIQAKFEQRVWKGAVVRLLLARRNGQPLCVRHQVCPPCLHGATHVLIQVQAFVNSLDAGSMRTWQGHEECRVKIPLLNLRMETLSALHHSRCEIVQSDALDKPRKDILTSWVPAILLSTMREVKDTISR